MLATAAVPRASVEASDRSAGFTRSYPDCVFEFTSDGKLAYANKAAHKLAALVSRPVSEILPAQFNSIVQECLANGQSQLRIETRLAARTISWLFLPIPPRHAVCCHANDITDRLNLEAQLRQSQKLAAIGQLAGGVAHDFNNMLTAILGHTSVLLAEANQPPPKVEALKAIVLAAKRAANLACELLDFTHPWSVRFEPLDLNEVIRNFAAMMRHLIGEQIKLNFAYSPDLPPVFGDPSMLQQVILNLAVNARDAMPQGGQLILNTACDTVREEHAHKQPNARPGRSVRFSVTDTGCGIPADVAPHIFEPFFTTKDAGKGPGLGLATV